jgi:hypothetical protein
MNEEENKLKEIQMKRQEKYREKRRESLGGEEYKKQQALKKREYRLKKKAEIREKVIDKLEENKLLEDNITTLSLCISGIIKKQDDNSKKKYPSDKTIKTQLNRIKLLFNYIYDGEVFDCSNWDWVKKITKISESIENNENWKTLNSKSAIYGALASILKYITGMEKYQNEYSNIVTANINKLEIEYGDNIMSDNVKKNYITWLEILSICDELEDEKEKLIYSLYVEIAPRRLLDYSHMKMLKSDNKGKMNKKYNYVIIKGEEIEEMIFNVYKTKNTYGQQILNEKNSKNIKKISNVLLKYIDKEKIGEDELLFPDKKERVNKKFDEEIANIFEGYVESEKRISVNVLRHAFISSVLKGGNISLNSRKEIAYQMGNSLNSQNNYFYFDG